MSRLKNWLSGFSVCSVLCVFCASVAFSACTSKCVELSWLGGQEPNGGHTCHHHFEIPVAVTAWTNQAYAGNKDCYGSNTLVKYHPNCDNCAPMCDENVPQEVGAGVCHESEMDKLYCNCLEE